jgi:hypothetical protein
VARPCRASAQRVAAFRALFDERGLGRLTSVIDLGSQWCSVEDLSAVAFDRARIVMVNEAHNGFSRCPRTRQVGRRVIAAAHAAGCRTLAMEALPNFDGPAEFVSRLPQRFGYLAQPEMVALVDEALQAGWQLVAYEQAAGQILPEHRADQLSLAATNHRELMQAENLARIVCRVDGPVLVWCGNDHAMKWVPPEAEWVPMGVRFAQFADDAVFLIDQTATIRFTNEYAASLTLDEATQAMLNHRFGGTAGLLHESLPTSGQRRKAAYDAIIASIDNEMIGATDEPPAPLSGQR